MPLRQGARYAQPVRPLRMDIPVERIEHQENLPLRTFVHSVRSCASHHHRECEFLLVLKGELVVHTATGETLLGPDDLFFVHGHELHLTRGVITPNLVATLQVDPVLAQRLDPDFSRRRFAFNQLARTRRDDPRLQAVRALLAETLWEMRLRRPGYRLLVEAHVLRLLGLMVRDIPATLLPAARASATDADDALGQRLARIVGYIEAHSREELSSADLAEEEGVSVSYLARLFKERLGTTFGDYLNQVRVRQSLPRLAGEAVTVLDLALDCGFPSVKAYNVIFKRLYRQTPTEWRRQRQGLPVPGLGESAYVVADTGLAYHLLKRHLPLQSPLRES